MQYQIALPGVGGWVYFKLDLALRMVEDLHLTPKMKLGVDLTCWSVR